MLVLGLPLSLLSALATITVVSVVLLWYRRRRAIRSRRTPPARPRGTQSPSVTTSARETGSATLRHRTKEQPTSTKEISPLIAESATMNRSQRKAVKEFQDLTQTNEATAKHYLNGAGWDMQPAVNAYYEAGCKTYGQKAAPFDESRAAAWFETYQEMGCSQPQFGRQKLPQFCSDIGIDGNDTVLFVFAWKCECEVFCRFTQTEFMRGLAHPDVRADNADKLKEVLPKLRAQLSDSEKFRDFFLWLFNYAKPTGTRGVAVTAAQSLWPLFLKSGPYRFEYLDEWVEYISGSGQKQIKHDTWEQLLPFISLVQNDASLADYNEADAWPCAIDEFVAWLKENNKLH